jgi:hypothetical protein
MHIREVRQIDQREGFEVWNRRAKGRLLRITSKGEPGPYPYRRRAPNHWTVAQYRKNRFRKVYPGVTCDVLTSDGKPARGNVCLATVRARRA